MSGLSIALTAVGLMSLAVSVAQPGLAITLVLIALGLYIWSMRTRRLWADQQTTRWVALLVAGISVLSVVLGRDELPESLLDVRIYVVVAGAVAAAAAWGLAGASSVRRRILLVLVAMACALAVTGFMIANEWNSELGTDVYHAHRAAGTALLNGENPYTDAVRFFDGSPYAPEGAVYEGYPYPPLVLITYGLVAAFTDPRLVSTIAWLGLLVWSARAYVSAVPGSAQDHALGPFLVLATAPAWPLLWFAAWTEPLSLFLFLVAAIAWRRGVLVSGVTLGLALASKQYFVVLAPFLILLDSRDGRYRRVLVAFATVLLTMLPFVLLDPVAYYQATLVNLFSIGFRPDTVSIPGLAAGLGADIVLPQWVVVGVTVAVAVLLGRYIEPRPRWIEGATVVMATTFALGLAFPNYWFLIMGLMAMSLTMSTRAESDLNVTGQAVEA
jgi:hypothetical protein